MVFNLFTRAKNTLFNGKNFIFLGGFYYERLHYRNGNKGKSKRVNE